MNAFDPAGTPETSRNLPCSLCYFRDAVALGRPWAQRVVHALGKGPPLPGSVYQSLAQSFFTSSNIEAALRDQLGLDLGKPDEGVNYERCSLIVDVLSRFIIRVAHRHFMKLTSINTELLS